MDGRLFLMAVLQRAGQVALALHVVTLEGDGYGDGVGIGVRVGDDDSSGSDSATDTASDSA
jgi:hypothetical protein